MAFEICDSGGSGSGTQVVGLNSSVTVTICTTPNIANTMFIVTFHYGSISTYMSCLGLAGLGTVEQISGTNVIKVGKNTAVKLVFTNADNANADTAGYSYNYVGVTIN